jgi:hypothetical protein
VLKINIKNISEEIIEFYNEYDLKVAGKIKNHTAFEIIEKIEKKFPVDSIKLSDGTKIWNLIRVFIYGNIEKQNQEKKRIIKDTLKSIFFTLKESFAPIRIPKKKINICGFSSTESRKYRDGKFYDIYMDPLYEIVGDNFAVFEWPEISGYRRKYRGKIYSKNYVPMHIPIYTKTFWNILFYKLLKHRKNHIHSEEKLNEIIEFISKTTSVNKDKLKKEIYDFITIFFYVKEFLRKILKNISPKAVLIRCGYGRFPMALSQACRELGIISIELQHGLITSSLPAYIKTTKSGNRDCVPEYLLTHGDVFTDMVKKGHLFEENKIISTGFPYLEKIKEGNTHKKQKKSISPFKQNIIVTSQWTISNEIQEYAAKVAEETKKSKLNIGILLKPHPYDKTDYSNFKNYNNITLIDKYEDIFELLHQVEVHSTVYSTSGLDAMALGKPNIFIDIYNLMKKTNTRYIVKKPAQFVETLQNIISNYSSIKKQTLGVANMFFKSHPEKNYKEFFTKLKLI